MKGNALTVDWTLTASGRLWLRATRGRGAGSSAAMRGIPSTEDEPGYRQLLHARPARAQSTPFSQDSAMVRRGLHVLLIGVCPGRCTMALLFRPALAFRTVKRGPHNDPHNLINNPHAPAAHPRIMKIEYAPRALMPGNVG